MGKNKGNVITRLLHRWFIEAFSAMALGVFASLLIGTIISQIGKWTGFDFLKELGGYAMSGYVVGASIGAAVATGIKVKPFAVFTATVCGAIGYCQVKASGTVTAGPLGAYVASLIAAELSNLVAGKTKFDILVVPSVGLLSGGTCGILLAPYIIKFCDWIGRELSDAITLQPVFMGIIIAVVMGLALTAPISSAAIAASIFTASSFEGNEAIALASGVATVGCCCQMMGFAIISWRENKLGGFVAQGLGTSMLQIANIVKNPLILIPPTLASAILGPVAATVLTVKNGSGTLGGMGTSGLVGPAGMWATMMPNGFEWFAFIKIILMCFILPMVLSLLISEAMRKLGLIKNGDMRLEL